MNYPDAIYPGADDPCFRKCQMVVIVIGWKRPDMLDMTLASLVRQLEGMDYCLRVAVNETTPEIEAVVAKHSQAHLYASPVNRGINRAIEDCLPADANEQFQYIMVSDGDIHYQEPIKDLLHPLNVSGIGAVCLQDPPETEAVWEDDRLPQKLRKLQEQGWTLKRVERCGMLVMKMERFHKLRPLPVHKILDFDWWVMRDSKFSLRNVGEYAACKPLAGIHVAYRSSLWSRWDIPETAEARIIADELYARYSSL